VRLIAPEDFSAVAQFYADFRQVENEEALELLRTATQDFQKRRQRRRRFAHEDSRLIQKDRR
jgi:predicted phosphoribosyltransferase